MWPQYLTSDNTLMRRKGILQCISLWIHLKNHIMGASKLFLPYLSGCALSRKAVSDDVITSHAHLLSAASSWLLSWLFEVLFSQKSPQVPSAPEEKLFELSWRWYFCCVYSMFVLFRFRPLFLYSRIVKSFLFVFLVHHVFIVHNWVIFLREAHFQIFQTL